MNSRPDRYHHGDLERALVDAATTLVASSGPEGCSLRQVARDVGVSPSAAYRHFAGRDDLLRAVARQAYDRLGVRVSEEIDALPRRRDPVRVARERLRAIGVAYVRWALENPGLFRAALGPLFDPKPGGLPTDPYLLLVRCVEDLVDAGALDPRRADGADLAIWATAHGLAVLVLDGAVDLGPDANPALWAANLVDVTVEGLLSGSERLDLHTGRGRA